MAEQSIPLTTLSEAQRRQALERFAVLRPALEEGVPRGHGKGERFFRSVDQLFLQDMPGYAPKGYGEGEATLTLPDFEQRFRKWLLEDYHHQVHSETECQPKDRWFVSLQALSLRCCPLGCPDPGVSHGVLYSCGFCLCHTS